MPVKANLDDIAARIVHAVAVRENRSFSNAASTLVREAYRQRQTAKTTSADSSANAGAEQ